MRRIHLVFAALVVVAVVALAACGGSSSSASGKFCGLVKQVNNDKTLNSDANTLGDAKKTVPATRAAGEELSAAAPPEIKSDMRTEQQFVTELADAVVSAKSDQDWMKNSLAVINGPNSATLKAASSRVDAYTKQHCGTTLNAGS